jgi:hypothetical protein
VRGKCGNFSAMVTICNLEVSANSECGFPSAEWGDVCAGRGRRSVLALIPAFSPRRRRIVRQSRCRSVAKGRRSGTDAPCRRPALQGSTGGREREWRSGAFGLHSGSVRPAFGFRSPASSCGPMIIRVRSAKFGGKSQRDQKQPRMDSNEHELSNREPREREWDRNI